MRWRACSDQEGGRRLKTSRRRGVMVMRLRLCAADFQPVRCSCCGTPFVPVRTGQRACRPSCVPTRREMPLPPLLGLADDDGDERTAGGPQMDRSGRSAGI